VDMVNVILNISARTGVAILKVNVSMYVVEESEFRNWGRWRIRWIEVVQVVVQVRVENGRSVNKQASQQSLSYQRHYMLALPHLEPVSEFFMHHQHWVFSDANFTFAMRRENTFDVYFYLVSKRLCPSSFVFIQLCSPSTQKVFPYFGAEACWMDMHVILVKSWAAQV
jgi:hypothetical protein